MSYDREMQKALEADGEKLRQLTGEDHGPWTFEPAVSFSPCPHCFESSGYVWEHGTSWETGPWSHQTNIPCRECNGTGVVEEYEQATLDDLLERSSP